MTEGTTNNNTPPPPSTTTTTTTTDDDDAATTAVVNPATTATTNAADNEQLIDPNLHEQDVNLSNQIINQQEQDEEEEHKRYMEQQQYHQQQQQQEQQHLYDEQQQEQLLNRQDQIFYEQQHAASLHHQQQQYNGYIFPSELIIEEHIDYSLVYALHTFVANLEGQVCVLKGDALDLLDDSNSYWWLVKCIKTDEIGYIPAENIETPFERLARINKVRNVPIAMISQQDMDEPPKVTIGIRRGIKFAESPIIHHDYDLYEYDDDDEYEFEDGGVEGGGEWSGNGEEGAAGNAGEVGGSSGTAGAGGVGAGVAAGKKAAKVERVVSMSLSGSFFKKLLGRSSTSKEKTSPTSPENTAASATTKASGRRPSVSGDRRPSLSEEAAAAEQQQQQTQPQQSWPQQTAQGAVAPAEKTQEEPINVLRIYAGNVDLKATFKSIAINKDMNFGDLLEAALKRFRVSGAAAGEYYLSVLHFDSQERRLPETDNVVQTLQSYRHKSLPGISATRISRAKISDGKVSSVLMNDDNLLKVIINKKLNHVEKNYHLIRIFMYDEGDLSGKIRTYKTIAVDRDLLVGEIVEIAVKKFKAFKGEGDSFKLCEVVKGKESVLDTNERIYPILTKAENSQEIDFILRKESAANRQQQQQQSQPGVSETIPSNTSGESSGGDGVSGTAGSGSICDVDNLIRSKPAFLEELPMSPQSLASNAPAGTAVDGNSGTAVAGSGETQDAVGASGTVSESAGSPPGSVEAGVLQQQEIEGPAAGDLPQEEEAKNAPVIVGTETTIVSGGEISMDAARNSDLRTSVSSANESTVESSIVAGAGADAGLRSSVGSAGEGGVTPVVPPRKVSLSAGGCVGGTVRLGSIDSIATVESLTGSMHSARAGSPSLQTSSTVTSPIISATSPIHQRQPVQQQQQQQQYQYGGNAPISSSSSTDPSAVKSSFGVMEEYLEEIMKESVDPGRLESLEAALRKVNGGIAAAAEQYQIHQVQVQLQQQQQQQQQQQLQHRLRTKMSSPDLRASYPNLMGFVGNNHNSMPLSPTYHNNNSNSIPTSPSMTASPVPGSPTFGPLSIGSAASSGSASVPLPPRRQASLKSPSGSGSGGRHTLKGKSSVDLKGVYENLERDLDFSLANSGVLNSSVNGVPGVGGQSQLQSQYQSVAMGGYSGYQNGRVGSSSSIASMGMGAGDNMQLQMQMQMQMAMTGSGSASGPVSGIPPLRHGRSKSDAGLFGAGSINAGGNPISGIVPMVLTPSNSSHTHTHTPSPTGSVNNNGATSVAGGASNGVVAVNNGWGGGYVQGSVMAQFRGRSKSVGGDSSVGGGGGGKVVNSVAMMQLQETEVLLGNMQRNLDKIVASAINVYGNGNNHVERVASSG
ncbi:hypothetical protein HDU76_001742 [Blyttiomyces sp. JEL0837]|nr:hypothetical protein HDU76_001742 [Blyttiomyces sp. JEL0837]